MRRLYSLFLLATLVAAGACGDDDANVPPDAPPPDAPDDIVSITDFEGGNFIFEYITVDSELQGALQLPTDTVTRVMGYFENKQTPEANPLPLPGECENLDANQGWPMFTGSPHTDLDAGDVTITGKNTAGDDVTIALEKFEAMTDNIGRPHDIFYQNIIPDADANLQPNTAYDVHITGGDVLPEHTFTGADGLFMPQYYDIGDPLIEDNGPLTGDFTVNWLPTDSDPSQEIIGLVWLIDSNGSPAFVCVADRESGSFTIPAQVIEDYKTVATARGAVPTKVILSRQAVAHHTAGLPNGEDGARDPANKRRVDMLGIMCWIQLMDVE